MTLVNSFPSKSWLIFLLLGAFGRLHAQTIPAVNEYPMGWFGPAVSAALATTQTSAEDNEHPTGLAGSFGGTIQTGAGGFDAKERNAHRTVTDLVVPGAVAPFTYTRTWNSHTPGLEWRDNWTWDVEEWNLNTDGDRSGLPWEPGQVFYGYIITFPDGRRIKFRKPTNDPTIAGAPGIYRATMSNPEYLVIDPDQDGHLHLSDGSIVNWVGGAPGNNITDPHGLVTTFARDGTGATTITEPGGRWIKIGPAQFSNAGRTGQYTVTSSLGQTVTYLSMLDVAGEPPEPDGNVRHTSRVIVTYNDVIDPATNLPVQAQYLYKQVQPLNTGAAALNPNAPPPPPIYRLEWASDPMFEGPVQQAKFVYGAQADPYRTAVLEVRYCTNYYTDPGVLLSRVEMLPYPAEGSQYSHQGYYERNETRGDGATRLISYWNTTNVSPTLRVDHITDWNNPNLSERFEYGAFYRVNKVTDMRGKVTSRILEPVVGNPTRETHHDTSYRSWTYTDPAYPYYVHTKKDELGHTTIYTRNPTTHRVERIDHPGVTFEKFEYNSFGQMTVHQQASHTEQYPAKIHYDYDARGLLKTEWNDVDGWGARKEYTHYVPGESGGKPDLVKTMTDGRARAAGAPYSALTKYNGRHQPTELHYPPTGSSPDPKVTYGYDKWGRRISVTNELGHTTTTAYDDYGRPTGVTEPLNAPNWNGTATVASRTREWSYERVRNGITYAADTHVSNNWRTLTEPAFDKDGNRRRTVREYDVKRSTRHGTDRLDCVCQWCCFLRRGRRESFLYLRSQRQQKRLHRSARPIYQLRVRRSGPVEEDNRAAQSGDGKLV